MRRRGGQARPLDVNENHPEGPGGPQNRIQKTTQMITVMVIPPSSALS